MIGLLAFWSSRLAGDLSNFLGGPVAALEGAGVIGVVSGTTWALYHKHKCGHCWRIGRHPVTVHTEASGFGPQAGKAHSTTYPSCKKDLDRDHAEAARRPAKKGPKWKLWL